MKFLPRTKRAEAVAAAVLSLQGALVRAARIAGARGITMLDSRGRNRVRRCFPDVLASTRRIAERWRAARLRQGDRVLVALPAGWEWVDGWMGALLAGGIPAAAPSGGPLGSGRAHLDRLAMMADTVDARFVLVSEALRADAIALGLRGLAERIITFERLTTLSPASRLPQDGSPSPIAFLQFTSGTAGFPRAVAISHEAAVYNALALNQAILAPLEGGTIETIVSWLPLYHDMGLVGAFLHAILTGRDLILLPARTYLAWPAKWLSEIASSAGALSLCPAFGLRHCAQSVGAEEVSGINLAGWRAAVCGAEPIPPQVVGDFASAFAPCGFRNTIFRAGYGLAEATLAVTLDQRGKGLRTRHAPAATRRLSAAQEVVCLGTPVPGTEIRCAAPDGGPRQEDQIGEILVRGPGLFSGYFGDAAATEAAMLDGWLRTGDLGFIYAGELHLTGRIKDVLIVRGEKFMPQEIEWVADAVCGSGSRAAAFSVSAGRDGEVPVLIVETPERSCDRLAPAAREVRSRIGETTGLQLADLLFVRRGSLPRTSSGKLRRAEARSQYLAGRFQNRACEVSP